MNTQKLAITIPKDLVAMIDEMSTQKGISRSKFISLVLKERIKAEKEQQVREAYDRIFSDQAILKEQAEFTQWFAGAGTEEGQEW